MQTIVQPKLEPQLKNYLVVLTEMVMVGPIQSIHSLMTLRSGQTKITTTEATTQKEVTQMPTQKIRLNGQTPIMMVMVTTPVAQMETNSRMIRLNGQILTTMVSEIILKAQMEMFALNNSETQPLRLHAAVQIMTWMGM